MDLPIFYLPYIQAHVSDSDELIVIILDLTMTILEHNTG